MMPSMLAKWGIQWTPTCLYAN